MADVVSISENALGISVKQDAMINFTARERNSKKDVILPFQKYNDIFYINFYDLSRYLDSGEADHLFYDIYLWLDGKCYGRIKNTRKRPREISKVFETVNRLNQINKKITITPFKTSISTLGCELSNKSVREKEFISNDGIKINYTQKIMKDNFRNKLIVTFPYSSPMDTKFKNSEAFYQYQKTLQNVGVNKISLKDNGGKHGNWFLGFGNFKHMNATKQFLEKKFQELAVNKEDVIFFGVSKGGYNAILFGLLLGIGNVVVSSPIGKIYSFLKDRPHQYDYVFPSSMTSKQIEKYEDLIGEVAKKKGKKPNVYAITSENDEYYAPHIPYLESVFKENEIKYAMYHNPNPDITRHGMVYNRSRNEIYAILYQLICGDDSLKIIK